MPLTHKDHPLPMSLRSTFFTSQVTLVLCLGSLFPATLCADPASPNHCGLLVGMPRRACFATHSLLRLSRLNTDTLSLSSGSWMSKIQVSQGGFHLRPLSWACRQLSPPPSSHGHPSVYICVLMSSSYKDHSHFGLEATLMTSFNLNYFLKDPISKYSLIEG